MTPKQFHVSVLIQSEVTQHLKWL